VTAEDVFFASRGAGMFRLDDKVAIVTGGARGIGAATARALAASGAAVVVADIQCDLATRTADEIVAVGSSAMSFHADITDEGDVDRLFEASIKWRGRVDICVFSAGISHSLSLCETTLEEWNHVLRVNLTGPFLCARAAVSAMRKQGGGGRLIFIGSGVAHQGVLLGQVAYAASKGGVHALAKTVARIGAPLKITANVIAPGITDTELLRATHSIKDIERIATTVPLGIGSADDVAAAVVYLASDMARHVTGATFDVNGGQVIH